ncbi:MAG: CBS domain-containing protein [Pseudomonadaceae bacterium]|nr:CBS domain-containing protein [Pseudomonadaceae bacterium]
MQQVKLPVKEFTTQNPIVVTEEIALDELMMLMEGAKVRHLPVVGQGTVIGIISDRDLRLFAGISDAEKYQVCAGDIMSPDPLTVSSSMPLDEVAFIMAEKKVGSVIVVEDEQLYGIFTATDALKALVEVIRKGR